MKKYLLFILIFSFLMTRSVFAEGNKVKIDEQKANEDKEIIEIIEMLEVIEILEEFEVLHDMDILAVGEKNEE